MVSQIHDILKDPGATPKHGCTIIVEYPKQYFHLYLKEFRFNHRQEDVFRVLTDIVEKTVPNV